MNPNTLPPSPRAPRRRKTAPQSAEQSSGLREAVEMLQLLMRRAAELADQCQSLADLLRLQIGRAHV
jgi:hypothetical protein